LALRTGSVGLGYEASLGPVGLGPPFGVGLGPDPGPSRGMLQLCGCFGCPLRPTLNRLLRTGTDTRNPTVSVFGAGPPVDKPPSLKPEPCDVSNAPSFTI